MIIFGSTAFTFSLKRSGICGKQPPSEVVSSVTEDYPTTETNTGCKVGNHFAGILVYADDIILLAPWYM